MQQNLRFHLCTDLLGTPIRGALLSTILLFSSLSCADQHGSPLTLDPVVVEGTPGVATEGTQSYSTERATVGYKQPVDIQRVPQTVNVITRQRLDDGGAQSLESAANLLANLTNATGNGFVGSLYSRGHEVFTYTVDGAPRPFLSLYGSAPDLVFFDRVEVLSGPSGVFQGSGEPVGTLNLVRKRAPFEPIANAALFFGSYDFKRAEVDLGGPITEGGGIRGRVIAFGLDEESFLDFANRDRAGGSGTLEFDIGDATTLSIGGITEAHNVSSHSGLPTFEDGRLLDVPEETYIGAPWNKNDSRTHEGFLEIEHEFRNGAVFKASGRTYDRETDIKTALALSAVDSATGDFDMFVFARDWQEDTSYLDANFTLPFRLLQQRSELTIGIDRRETEQSMKQNFDFSLGTQNIATFDPKTLVEPTVSFPGVGPGFRLNTVTDTEETGLYAYTLLGLSERWNLSLGARYAEYDSATRDTARGTITRISEERFVPFAGISFDVAPMVTLYASYSEIFQPQSEQDSSGAQLEPLTGQQVEVGAKYRALDGKLMAQASVFRLDDENRAVDDTNNVGFSRAAGDDKTTGIELSVAGSPMPGLDLALGYAYADIELESDPTAEHNAVASAKYSFRSGALAGAYVGINARAAGDFQSQDDDVTIRASSYAVADLLLGYQINKHFEAQLLVTNLFDREYVERVNTTSRGVFYGEPLSAMASIRASF